MTIAQRTSELFTDVHEIAVVRGGGLGDVLFAVPAIEALAAAYPEAHITVLGSPLHAELLPGRLETEVSVEVLPISAGVRAGVEDPRATQEFVERMHGRFDLGVQLHGGGRSSNPFLTRLAPRHTVGAATSDALELERTLPYLYFQHEVARDLEIVALAGASPVALEPRVIARADDFDKAARVAPPVDRPTIVIHPGATDVRRRWPTERFAEIARRLVRGGCRVLIVGDGGDAALADDILSRVEATPLLESLAGRVDIGGLCGVLSSSDLLIGNDSGPRHLAQALGVPTASVFWAGNLINAGPAGRGRHRVQLSWTTSCPVCGRDATQVGWTAVRCEHDVSFVRDVSVEAVWRDVAALTATTLPPRDK
jgi:ADP-heptose:LPS heptosyltransferase